MSGDRRTRRYTTLRYEVADAIATITLDRPDALNALTIPMKTELLAAFGAVARDRAVRAVVLTGAGRAFCAGQDLKERLEPDAAPLAVEVRERYNPIIRGDAEARPADRRGDQRRGRRRGRLARVRLRHPGRGRGRELRPGVRADRARARTAARRGSCHGSSGRPRPPSWRCSASRCRRADAERFGLVARVVPAEALADEARAVAARWPALAPLALAPDEARPPAQLVGRSRDGARGRGLPPGDRRSHGRPRRGPRGVPREAAAAVHRGVARAQRRTLTSHGRRVVGWRLTSVS